MIGMVLPDGKEHDSARNLKHTEKTSQHFLHDKQLQSSKHTSIFSYIREYSLKSSKEENYYHIQ